jgi:hypothetical protein
MFTFRGHPRTGPAVIYDADPRTDLTALDRPLAVILRGRLVRP